MNYEQAKAHADRGKAVILTNTGGWKRYGWFTLEQPTGIVKVRLFQTTIARFHPDGRITLHTGGYETATTFEALNVLVSDYGVIWKDRDIRRFHPYNGEAVPFENGMEVPA